MKTKFFAATVLCVLGLAGCNQETIDDAGTAPGKTAIMTMYSDGPKSRVDYTEDKNGDSMVFSWRTGDEMSVAVHGVGKGGVVAEVLDGNENCQLKTTTEGSSAAFAGNVVPFNGTKYVYSVYPYSKTGYKIKEGTHPADATTDLTLERLLNYEVKGQLTNSYLVGMGEATAVTDDKIEAKSYLKQVMSIIKLNFVDTPAKITEVKITSKDRQPLFPTKATVTMKTGEIVPGTYTDLVNELKMNVTDTTTALTKSVSFTMFPADLSGKEFIITILYDNKKTTVITKTGINFKRNVHYVTNVIYGLQVGDFYMNNGAIVSKTETLTPEQKLNCLGIVIKVGQDGSGTKKDDGTYMQKNGVSKMGVKGYVLALNDVAGTHVWTTSTAKWVGTNVEKVTGFYGYSNTKAIEAFVKKEGGDLETLFPATYAATVLYEAAYPAPVTSSGWFLPSAGQCLAWVAGRDVLLASERAIKGNPDYFWESDYWSSSESSTAAATGAYGLNMNHITNKYFMLNYINTTKNYVRPILVF